MASTSTSTSTQEPRPIAEQPYRIKTSIGEFYLELDVSDDGEVGSKPILAPYRDSPRQLVSLDLDACVLLENSSFGFRHSYLFSFESV
jgi:hypothetical protein